MEFSFLFSCIFYVQDELIIIILSGYKITITEDMMPLLRGSTDRLPSAFWNERDGFSIIGPLLFAFDEEAILNGMMGVINITTTDDQQLFDMYINTVVLDSVTGKIKDNKERKVVT